MKRRAYRSSKTVRSGYSRSKRTRWDVVESATFKPLPNKNLAVKVSARYTVRWFVKGALQTREFYGLDVGLDQAVAFVREELK